MKRNLCNNILTVFMLCILSACGYEKEIDYKTLYSGDKIVVHGFISLEHGAEAVVKKTVIPNEIEASDFISNPTVWLYENDKPFIQLMKENSSKYRSPAGTVLNKANQYSIHVSCDGFDDVYSNPQPLINKLFIDTVYVSKHNKGQSKYFLAFEFNDIPGEDNYFMYKVHEYYKGTDQYHNAEFIDPLAVKKDADYNTTRLIFETEINNWISSDEEFNGFDSIVFELVTVSKDYYTYSRSADYYEGTVSSEFDEYVYPIFSNITNGIGFFASWESTSYTFFPPDSLER
ncbi:MAG TPA: DUF4249 domain-containing protein [Prolixibacteraceae bacterium]|nr:DUF4249 domain-containing protein [Prolixibacteraceae bacterium]